eukprot:1370262-Amorphochlora_amoeboformis.AAC.1
MFYKQQGGDRSHKFRVMHIISLTPSLWCFFPQSGNVILEAVNTKTVNPRHVWIRTSWARLICGILEVNGTIS